MPGAGDAIDRMLRNIYYQTLQPPAVRVPTAPPAIPAVEGAPPLLEERFPPTGIIPTPRIPEVMFPTQVIPAMAPLKTTPLLPTMPIGAAPISTLPITPPMEAAPVPTLPEEVDEKKQEIVIYKLPFKPYKSMWPERIPWEERPEPKPPLIEKSLFEVIGVERLAEAMGMPPETGREAFMVATMFPGGGVAQLSLSTAQKAAGVAKTAKEITGLQRALQQVAKAAKITKTPKVLDIPPTEQVAAMLELGKPTMGKKLSRLPFIKKAVKLVDPSKVATDPILQARVIEGTMQDIAEAGILGALAKARTLRPKNLRVVGGIVKSPKIVQIKLLPGNEKSMALHDIIEWADRYTMSKAMRAYVAEIRTISSIFSRMARKEGLPIKQMAGEGDFAYLHRVVIEVTKSAADDLARQAAVTLRGVLPRRKDENSWTYLVRLSDELASGRLEPPPELEGIMDNVGKLVQVDRLRQRLGRPRFYQLTADGLRAGVKYADDPVYELAVQGRLTYSMTIQKRIGEFLSKGVITTTREELIAEQLGYTPAAMRAILQQARRAQAVAQRVIRGEKPIPPQTLEAIEMELPELGARLREIAHIPVQTHADILKGLLPSIRALEKKAPKIGRGLRAIIIQLERGKTPIVRAKRIQLAFRDFEHEYPEIADALRNLARMQVGKMRIAAAKALLPSIKDEIIKASRKLNQALRLARMRLPAGYGEVVGVPGISGRVIPTQVIGGKLYQGREIAAKIQQEFGFLPRGVAEDAVRAASLVGGIMRMAKASLDLSVTVIQTSPVLGLDTANFFLYPARLALKHFGIFKHVQPPTAAWAKGLFHSWRAAIDKGIIYESKYWAKDVNRYYLYEAAKRGALAQPSEYLEYYGPVLQKLSKIPGIGKGTEEVFRQTYGRAEAAFTAGRNITANEMRKGMWAMAEAEGNLTQLCRASNILTGVLSSRGMGIKVFQRNFETAVPFFAPRFTRAMGAILGHIIWNPGSYTGKLALQSVVGLVSALTLTNIAATTALGQKPRIDPRPKSVGGNGADWLGAEVGGRMLSVGGIFSDIRAVMSIVSAAFTDPESLLQVDMANPIFRRMRAKFAPPTSALYDYLSGYDYIGRPVRGTSLTPTKETAAMIGKWGIPIWIEGLVEEGWSTAAAATEFFGGRTFPISPWVRLERLRDEIAQRDYGKPWMALSRKEWRETEQRYPELADLTKVAKEEMRKWAPARRDRRTREAMDKLEGLRLGRYEAGRLLEKEMNETSLFGDALRKKIQEINSNYGHDLEQWDKDYPEMELKFAEWAQKGFEKLEREGLVEPVFNRLLAEFYEGQGLEDAYGNPLWEERDKRETLLQGKYGKELWAELEEYIISNPEEAYILRFYRQTMRQILRPYWAIPAENRAERLAFRASHPQVDALLVLFGYASVIQSSQGVSELEELFTTFGIEAEVPLRKGATPAPKLPPEGIIPSPDIDSAYR